MNDNGRSQYLYKNEDVQIALEEAFLEKGEKYKSEMVQEAQTAYLAGKHQGEYTLEDYYALPDDRRVELIDGVIYDMASPRSIHQLIGGELYVRFTNYIRKKKGNCISAVAPLDVQLDCDDKTMLQPDVLIVCDREKFQNGVVYGAPDLVVEILSKSTRRKDLTIKLAKYAGAGVKEYWIVDPNKKRVIVYEFEKGVEAVIYGFDHKVSVGIFGGDCQIDFREVYQAVEFLYLNETNL